MVMFSKEACFSFFSFLILSYFTYHLFQGGRGVFALKSIQSNVVELRKKEQKLKDKKEKIEMKVKFMNPSNLDKDLLEEQVKKNLFYVHKNEFVINLKKNKN